MAGGWSVVALRKDQSQRALKASLVAGDVGPAAGAAAVNLWK